MLTSEHIIRHMGRALEAARNSGRPYQHWVLKDVLPESVLKFQHSVDGHFVTQALQRIRPVSAALAEALQSRDLARLFRDVLRVNVEGSYLQIQSIRRANQSSTEPRRAVRENVFFMIVFMCAGDHAQSTEDRLVDRRDHRRELGTPDVNTAVIFTSSPRAQFNYQHHKSTGMRCRLEIKYVRPNWKSVEQLCFPHSPISAG